LGEKRIKVEKLSVCHLFSEKRREEENMLMCVLKKGEALLFMLVGRRRHHLWITKILKIVFNKIVHSRFYSCFGHHMP